MIKGISPVQTLVIPFKDINKAISIDTYQNYEELVNITVTAYKENADSIKQTFLKLSLNNHPYFGDGLPVKTLEPDIRQKILDRGYVFSDFYPDTPVAIAKNNKAIFEVVAPADSGAFSELIITIFYKNRLE